MLQHFCWSDDAASLYCKTNRESVRARGEKKKKRNKESNWMSFAERPGLMCRRSLFLLFTPSWFLTRDNNPEQTWQSADIAAVSTSMCRWHSLPGSGQGDTQAAVTQQQHMAGFVALDEKNNLPSGESSDNKKMKIKTAAGGNGKVARAKQPQCVL